MREPAKKLISLGFSVIPVNDKKQPMVAFKRSGYTKHLPSDELDKLFDSSHGIAIIAGAVSGNLLCIDVDLKYDKTGTLMTRLKERIIEAVPDFFSRSVLQKTVSGGYHMVFRVDSESKISGNKKLAMRNSTEEELSEDKDRNPKLKRSERVLIETRGEGGYFLVSPTPGYQIIKNSFDDIGTFTSDELDAILATCRSFSELFYDETMLDIPKQKIMRQRASNEISPWDDYNERTDGIELLESYGWKSNGYIDSNTVKLLRPGKPPGSREHSGYYHTDTKKLVVFSTSTPFDTERNGSIPAYTPFAIYAVYEHNGDIKSAISDLSEQGYGSGHSHEHTGVREVTLAEATKAKISAYKSAQESDDESPMDDPESHDEGISKFIGDFTNAVGYLNMARSQTLPEGLKFGFAELDRHWRLKKGGFVIIHGLANVGKSTFMWYIACLSAIAHGWRWIIYTGENDYEFVIRRMMETYAGKQIHNLSQKEWDQAEVFVRTHFTFITNEYTYSFRDILSITESLCKEQHYDALMIDPYNSLVVDDTISKKVKSISGNKHDYDYMATTEMRVFCRNTGISIYLNVHTGTEGARRVGKDPDTPPRMYEVEGGNKFAARADDFITVHRNTKSESSWMFTEVHVDKIKVQETGGKPTPEDKPVVFRFIPDRGRFMGLDGIHHRFDAILYHQTGSGLYSENPDSQKQNAHTDYYSPASSVLVSARKDSHDYFGSDQSDEPPF